MRPSKLCNKIDFFTAWKVTHTLMLSHSIKFTLNKTKLIIRGFVYLLCPSLASAFTCHILIRSQNPQSREKQMETPWTVDKTITHANSRAIKDDSIEFTDPLPVPAANRKLLDFVGKSSCRSQEKPWRARRLFQYFININIPRAAEMTEVAHAL